MPNPQASLTQRLATLIHDKLACLVQLRDLGIRQHQLIEGGEMTQLLGLLATKQRFIAMLQSIERDLTPFREDDPDSRIWDSPADRARCAGEAAQCKELLDEIVSQEKSNEALMHQRRHAVADRLHQVHAQARASGAYRAQGRAPAPVERANPAVRQPLETGPYASGSPTTLDVASDIR